MKLSTTFSLIASFLLGASAGAFAADHDSSAMSHSAAAGRQAAQTPLTDALVKKVDKVAGTVTLAAGPLANGMPAMTMDYRLKDASWFERLKEGQKIRIAVDDTGGVYTVTRLEPAGK